MLYARATFIRRTLETGVPGLSAVAGSRPVAASADELHIGPLARRADGSRAAAGDDPLGVLRRRRSPRSYRQASAWLVPQSALRRPASRGSLRSVRLGAVADEDRRPRSWPACRGQETLGPGDRIASSASDAIPSFVQRRIERPRATHRPRYGPAAGPFALADSLQAISMRAHPSQRSRGAASPPRTRAPASPRYRSAGR